jgi:hypothetical protein
MGLVIRWRQAKVEAKHALIGRAIANMSSILAYAPQRVAEELLAGLANDDKEIRVAQTAQFYEYHQASPAEAFAMMNSRCSTLVRRLRQVVGVGVEAVAQGQA